MHINEQNNYLATNMASLYVRDAKLDRFWAKPTYSQNAMISFEHVDCRYLAKNLPTDSSDSN